MKWFKHYSSAATSEYLSSIIEDFGFEGYGRYWKLLEYLNEIYDGEKHSFRVRKRVIRDLLRIRSWNGLDSYRVAIGNGPGIYIKQSGNVFEIDAPILLELKSRDYKKARQDRAKTAPKIKRKIKTNSSGEETTDTKFIKSVIDALNNELDTKYRPTTKSTIRLVDARRKEGFDNLDDYKKVFSAKKSEWQGTEFQNYLRPETLLGTKFETYLQQADKALNIENELEGIMLGKI